MKSELIVLDHKVYNLTAENQRLLNIIKIHAEEKEHRTDKIKFLEAKIKTLEFDNAQLNKLLQDKSSDHIM